MTGEVLWVAGLLALIAIAGVLAGGCRHRHTIWERRSADGSTRTAETPSSLFWVVCTDCGRAVAPVNPHDGATPPQPVGAFDGTKARAALARARATDRRRRQLAAARAVARPPLMLPARPMPPKGAPAVLRFVERNGT